MAGGLLAALTLLSTGCGSDGSTPPAAVSTPPSATQSSTAASSTIPPSATAQTTSTPTPSPTVKIDTTKACGDVISADEVRDITGLPAVAEDPQARYDPEIGLGVNCNFQTQGDLVNDLVIKLMASDRDTESFLRAYPPLRPIDGLGDRATISEDGTRVFIRLDQGFIEVEDSDAGTEQQLVQLARLVYPRAITTS